MTNDPKADTMTTTMLPGCRWTWIDEADIPDDGTKHRHVCTLDAGHGGDHQCGDDAAVRAE